MGGESPLLKEGALSLQTSHSLRELPPRAPAHAERKFDSLCLARVLSGEVLLFRAGGDFQMVRLRARLVGGMRNDPCVIPFRLEVTCCRGLCLWWAEIYPPSSVAYATNCSQFSSPPRGSLPYTVRTWQIWLCIVDCLCDPPSSVAFGDTFPLEGEGYGA